MGRPRAFSVGRLRVRAVRGPREPGVWYWRADLNSGGGTKMVWSGWGTAEFAASAVERQQIEALADIKRPPINLGPLDDAWIDRALTEPGAAGWVYWLADYDARRVKIGFSRNPIARIRGLLTAVPGGGLINLRPGSMDAERAVQAVYFHLRIAGEWFRWSEEVERDVLMMPARSIDLLDWAAAKQEARNRWAAREWTPKEWPT